MLCLWSKLELIWAGGVTLTPLYRQLATIRDLAALSSPERSESWPATSLGPVDTVLDENCPHILHCCIPTLI